MRSSFVVPIVALAVAACSGSSTTTDSGPDATDANTADIHSTDAADARPDVAPSDAPHVDAADSAPSDVASDTAPIDVVADALPIDVTDVTLPDVIDVASADTADVSDAGSTDVPSDTGGRIPLNHRPDDSECSGPAPAGDCTIPSGACTSDSTCTAGVNGRCIESHGGALFCSCTYDMCTHDTDCPTGQTCACHGAADTGGEGNTCITGNCRVDADCGAGGYCSPSIAPSGCGALGGYYCHTSADTCIDDSDCTSSSGSRICTYSTTLGHWQCTTRLLCP